MLPGSTRVVVVAVVGLLGASFDASVADVVVVVVALVVLALFDSDVPLSPALILFDSALLSA